MARTQSASALEKIIPFAGGVALGNNGEHCFR